MGASSSHPIFIALKELLPSKNLKIRKGTLDRFLNECDTVAPWFTLSDNLNVASLEKLGRDLDFAAEQRTLKKGVRPIWRLVRVCQGRVHVARSLRCISRPVAGKRATYNPRKGTTR